MTDRPLTSPEDFSEPAVPREGTVAPLYSRVLGRRFELLPPLLRQMHSRTEKTDWYGTFRVRRGTGWLRNLMATIAGLPPSCDEVPLQLTVEPIGDRELWSRRFGEHPMVSTQWQSGRFLIEAVGPSRLALELTADETGLTCESTRAWFLFIPLPHVLSPRVTAKETPTDDGWHVDVTLSLPMVGRMIQYTGDVKSTDSQTPG